MYKVDVYASDILIPIHRMLFPISSKSLRYAILALGSTWKAGHLSVETSQYLGQYYKYTKDVIVVFAYADIIYASYALIKLAFRFDEPLETVLTHFSGVSQCLSYFDTRPAGQTNDEQLCMERIWNDLLADFYIRILRDRRHEDYATLAKHVDTIYGFLVPHWPRVVSTLQFPRERDFSLKILEHRVRTLEIYFQYYFVHYLVVVNRPRNLEKITAVTASLRDVLHQMIELGSQLRLMDRFNDILEFNMRDVVTSGERSPKQLHKIRFDKALLSLYLWAVAIDSTLVYPASQQSTENATFAALALCRMYRPWAIVKTTFDMDTCSYNDARNLFLAGLILTKSHYPRGIIIPDSVIICAEKTWIKACLEPCIRGGRESYQLHSLVDAEIGLLQHFLDAADGCLAMQDIWTLKSNRIGLWQCIVGFSWFWGLDMITAI